MTTLSNNNNNMSLSCAALHNNLGALLQRRGSIEDATRHYHSAISSGEVKCDPSSRAGLAWFHRKLLAERQERGVGNVGNQNNNASCSPSISRRCSLVGTTVNNAPPCCDEHTPLGLEYYNKGPLAVTVSSDAVAAARLNLASLQYVHAKCTDELQQVLDMLNNIPPCVVSNNRVIAAARESNAGVILFRLSKTREALAHFQKATEIITSQEVVDHEHDDLVYLKMAVLLNHARVCVRINDTKTATANCQEIESLFSNNIKHNHLTPLVSTKTRWIHTVASQYIMGMVHQRQENLAKALECYKAFVTDARHDLGHSHVHVATVLYMKGMVLFDQRKLHHAMLAQLACLRIHEQCVPHNEREMAKCMYSIGRTLHDREEYRDALRMYQRTLSIQQRVLSPGSSSIDVVTTLCNIARVHHVIGDLDACLKANEEIVAMARRLAKGKEHAFVADRLVVLGNVLVEVGRLPEAMEAFADAARSGGGNHVRNSRYDIDSRSAATLAKAGLQHPSAATA